MGEIIKRSVGAGFMIGIGCLFYIMIPNRIVGAVMFSLGLLTILYCNLYLYTGMVGSVSKTRIGVLILVLLGNICGILLAHCISYFGMPDVFESVAEVGMAKMQKPLIQSFLQAVLCGALMQTAVVLFRYESTVGTMMCVTGFILCGLEHSIANCFWLVGCENYFPMILLYAVGNGIGAKMMNFLTIEKISKKLVKM